MKNTKAVSLGAVHTHTHTTYFNKKRIYFKNSNKVVAISLNCKI